MERLKIQDLQEGKIYRFYNGDGSILPKNIYIINKQGELYCGRDKYCKNKNGFSRSALIYNAIINGYFTEIKRKIDWTKVPRGTKVQVSLTERGDWFNRYFISIGKEDGEHAFVTSLALDDDFTSYEMEDFSDGWEYCRIHESVEIPDEWYKEVG